MICDNLNKVMEIIFEKELISIDDDTYLWVDLGSKFKSL